MHVTILGKRYRLRFAKFDRHTHGECDDPSTPGKEIRIAQGIGENETLDTIIHEALHAADWHKGEPWVEQVASDLARVSGGSVTAVSWTTTWLDPNPNSFDDASVGCQVL